MPNHGHNNSGALTIVRQKAFRGFREFAAVVRMDPQFGYASLQIRLSSYRIEGEL